MRLPEEITYDLPDAEVKLYPTFFTEAESDSYFAALRSTTTWGQGRLTLYGKTYDEPRLTAWHGDEGKSYSYSGIVLHPQPWTLLLNEIRARVNAAAQTTFNSVLLNLYRNGRDSNGWHQDNEPELGRNPVIASLSFGAVRRFQMRHKIRQDLKLNLDLPHGSLLLMTGETQHTWQHQIPKTAKPVGERINLTFRVIQ
ncbi:MAG: alpha-ketoglutarate-dependent dioxygenase AlkB [Acidobacteria bacterium]|nr:alpha-ketoglutarate-dependent dioxygenase AlkB [Acidobacteriota bacterium]